MILAKHNPIFQEIVGAKRDIAPLLPFFKRYKEGFVEHFIAEIKKETDLSENSEETLKFRCSRFYDLLFDFNLENSPEIAKKFLEVKNLGLAPLLLLQKLFSSLLLKLISDYCDDRDIFSYLKILSNYFDAVLEELKEILKEDATIELDMRLPLKEHEIKKWLPQGIAVRLLNVYKGVPVIYEGHIIKGDENSGVYLQVPIEKGVIAQFEKKVMLVDRRMEPLAIELNIKSATYKNNVAVLEVNSVAWVESIARRRKRVRVVLDKPLKAKLIALGRQFNVEVIDLSAKGVCLETESGFGLPLYEQVEVTLPIPQADKSVRNIFMRGTLQYISSSSNSKRKYHIYLHPSLKKEEILSSFIVREEIKILKEIKALARDLIKHG